jgi:hypothetical protein
VMGDGERAFAAGEFCGDGGFTVRVGHGVWGRWRL